MSENSNNVFLSWSEKISNAVAFTFSKYLPIIIQNARPFFSPQGIKKDEDWFNKIKSELISSKSGIIFLTKENLCKDWILFEAGGVFSKNSLCILLCDDIDLGYLKDNNSLFQYLNYTMLKNKEDVLSLFKTVNNAISPHVNEQVIESTFNKYYDDFKRELDEALVRTINVENNTFNVENNTLLFEGQWQLIYTPRNRNENNYENLVITKDGKYKIKEGNSERYYFQLNVLKSDSRSIIWQKLKVVDNNPTDEVHSVEDLQIGSNDSILEGEDTIGFKIRYTKI